MTEINGLLTVNDTQRLRRLGYGIHVWFNGHDVTRSCVACDSREGWALLFQRRGGHAFARRDRIAMSLITGHVVYTFDTTEASMGETCKICREPATVQLVKTDWFCFDHGAFVLNAYDTSVQLLKEFPTTTDSYREVNGRVYTGIRSSRIATIEEITRERMRNGDHS